MASFLRTTLRTFQIVWVLYGLLIASRNVVMRNVIARVIDYLTVGHMCTFVTEKGGADHRSWRPRTVLWNRVRSVRYASLLESENLAFAARNASSELKLSLDHCQV